MPRQWHVWGHTALALTLASNGYRAAPCLHRRGFRHSCISLPNPLRALIRSKKSRHLLSLVLQILSYRLFPVCRVPPFSFSPQLRCWCVGYVSHNTAIRSTNNPPCCSSNFPCSNCSQGMCLSAVPLTSDGELTAGALRLSQWLPRARGKPRTSLNFG